MPRPKFAAPASRASTPSPAQVITDAIVARLEAGTSPWKQPWTSNNGSPIVPRRWNGEPYRGINCIYLWAVAETKGYTNRRWMTYRQASKSAGQVRKGEKASLAVFYKSFGPNTRETDIDTDVAAKRGRVMRSYAVFNVEQIDGLPERYTGAEQPRMIEPSEHATAIDAFRDASGARIHHGGSLAAYFPLTDHIVMPNPVDFIDYSHYGATLAHELAHHTGHRTRLDRTLTGRYGSDDYAFEELVAEIASAMIGAELGLPVTHLDTHASYLAHWLRILKSDNRAILSAAAKAEQAADYLLRKAGIRTGAQHESIEDDDANPAEIRLAA